MFSSFRFFFSWLFLSFFLSPSFCFNFPSYFFFSSFFEQNFEEECETNKVLQEKVDQLAADVKWVTNAFFFFLSFSFSYFFSFKRSLSLSSTVPLSRQLQKQLKERKEAHKPQNPLLNTAALRGAIHVNTTFWRKKSASKIKGGF